MKKMKFAALFAAFVSVFGFTSCMSDNEVGEMQLQSLVTVESNMGYTTLYADEFPNQALVPTNVDLSQFGITPSTKRALIVYTVPEGQSPEASQVNITVMDGRPWAVYNVSTRPDTCAAYVDPMGGFSDFRVTYVFKSGFVSRDRYLNVGYKCRANTKAPSTVLLFNRVSNDTLYLDFKMKKNETIEGQEVILMDTYDLGYLNPSLLEGLVPVQDSVYVTVVGNSNYDLSVKDSVTNRCKSTIFRVVGE